MLNSKFILFIGFLLLFISCDPDNDPFNEGDPMDPVDTMDMMMDTMVGMYFPPMDHDIWDATDPASLGWNQSKLNDLITYLDNKNSKGFMIIKDGKIVVEEYFDDHTVNKNWNWYSAAKSLTSAMVGIATKEALIDIDEKTSTYLGNNWSSLPQNKQDLITVKNHITMTTGLQNKIGDFIPWTCTAPVCMQYEADAGSKWAYHQGAFTQTQNIITKATGLNFKQYCKQKIQDKIGMNGTWNPLLDVNIFSSTTRSMARFGLLALNEGEWDGATIYPKSYHEAMTNTSQDHNKGYGYLWWLNGKADFLGTADQTIYNGALIPNGPDDMFCALGAQDQKIYVIPSKNMVVVRCGEPAGNTEFANSSFDNELWGRINEVIE